MGQHKHNPTAIAAKKGDIPPKKTGLSKRQSEVNLMKQIEDLTGITHIMEKTKMKKMY